MKEEEGLKEILKQAYEAILESRMPTMKYGCGWKRDGEYPAKPKCEIV